MFFPRKFVLLSWNFSHKGRIVPISVGILITIYAVTTFITEKRDGRALNEQSVRPRCIKIIFLVHNTSNKLKYILNNNDGNNECRVDDRIYE